jgi:hypothetical protein
VAAGQTTNHRPLRPTFGGGLVLCRLPQPPLLCLPHEISRQPHRLRHHHRRRKAVRDMERAARRGDRPHGLPPAPGRAGEECEGPLVAATATAAAAATATAADQTVAEEGGGAAARAWQQVAGEGGDFKDCGEGRRHAVQMAHQDRLYGVQSRGRQ